MDAIRRLFEWIAINESFLSGLASVIAIAAVFFAIVQWVRGKLRKPNEPPAVELAAESAADRRDVAQDIRYCLSPGGQKIAWASAGDGYPLVRVLGWFSNLDTEWNSPDAPRFWKSLARRYRLIRYDGRGMGLSDREVNDFSPAGRLEDLEAVIDASGVSRFALFGLSEGGATAISYAAKHPDKVSHLVIWGSMLVCPEPEDIPQFGALARLVPRHWGGDSEAFHQMFAAMFLPEGNAAQNRYFIDMMRSSAAPQVAYAFMQGSKLIDVQAEAQQVRVPTLVIHRKGDLVVPVNYGRQVAAGIEDSSLELLDGGNHWMIGDDDDMEKVFEIIDKFILGGTLDN